MLIRRARHLARERPALPALLVLALTAIVVPTATDAIASSPAPQLSISFARHPNASELGVVVGRSAVIRGRAKQGRSGIPGMAVTAIAFVTGGQPSTVGSAVTSRSGRFSLHITGPPVAAFVYLQGGGLTSNTLTVRPTVAIQMKLSHHVVHPGRHLTFSGHVTPAVPAGVFVLLEVKRGRHYQTFAVRQLDAGDNFSKRYRFAAAHERYTFRAEIPRQSLFPYTDSTSRTVRVRVT